MSAHSPTFDLEQKPFAYKILDDPQLDLVSSPRQNPLITSIAFSNNGEYILVGTAGEVHYVLESFDLSILLRLEGHAGLGGRNKNGVKQLGRRKGMSGYEVCFTPDSKFVMSGESLPLSFSVSLARCLCYSPSAARP